MQQPVEVECGLNGSLQKDFYAGHAWPMQRSGQTERTGKMQEFHSGGGWRLVLRVDGLGAAGGAGTWGYARSQPQFPSGAEQPPEMVNN